MRKLMLIALELIRFTAVVVNLRNAEWKRRWNQVTIWISFQTWSNLNSPMLWRTIVGDRITFFNFAWNQSAIHRLGGRANGDKFDQFVSPRIEIAEISTRRKISSLPLSRFLPKGQLFPSLPLFVQREGIRCFHRRGGADFGANYGFTN